MAWNKSIFAILRTNNIAKRLSCIKYNFSIESCKGIHSTTNNVFHFTEPYKSATAVMVNQKQDWSKVLSDAARVVNCPTSFLSLRWVLSEEVIDVIIYLRKLISSNHPLLQIMKNIIYHGHQNAQNLGLIVLLISKAAGQLSVDTSKHDVLNGILDSQRVLAEITEMIQTSYFIHKEMINVDPNIYHDSRDTNDILVDNTITLLSGDYLLGNTSYKLAQFRNPDLLELMCSIVTDFTQAEFIGRRDNQNNPIPSVLSSNSTDYAVKEWTVKNVLSIGSMLAKSCKGALLIGGHSSKFQEYAYNFGENLSLAWQSYLELIPFNNKNLTSEFSLFSAPVLFHLEYDPTIMTEIEQGLTSIRNVNYTKIHNLIMAGPGVELTKQLRKKHCEKALESLSPFQENDAKTALHNIITAIENN